MIKKIKQIKLYSTTTCPYCRMEKTWLENKNIDHDIVMVDRDYEAAEAMVRKTGQMGVPVTEIQYEGADNEYIVGFDIPRLTAALGI